MALLLSLLLWVLMNVSSFGIIVIRNAILKNVFGFFVVVVVLLLWFLVNVSSLAHLLLFGMSFWRLFQVLAFVVGRGPDWGLMVLRKRELQNEPSNS